MESLQSIALAAGLAWGSGLRLYAMVFAAGMLARLGYLTLPAQLDFLQHPWVLGVAGVMLLIEFFADKVPLIDSLWDAVHSFIRIPAGAVLAALALGQHDPVLMFIAALLGGSLTAATHAAKAGSRAMINTSPEPFTNIGASLAEETLLAGGLYLAWTHPLLFLMLLALFVLVLIWLLQRLWRVWQRTRAPAASPPAAS
jgi:hypothetical protein